MIKFDRGYSVQIHRETLDQIVDLIFNQKLRLF
jgi:hypothetical protein